ncbi:MAG: TatD family hydrolase [Bacillota bacterium]|nr:TatD family hydrolase [Bacillota bacterium]
MLIDMHTHIGKMIGFDMPEEQLLQSMNKYGVDFSLVSNTEAAEADHQQNDIPIDMQYSQIKANEKTIEFVRNNPSKIGAMLWCKIKNETPDKEFISLISENRDVIYGLKFHPFHSATTFDDPKTEAFIKIAQEFRLPILIHTASDTCSAPICVYNMAKKYPDVNFVMGHMGLGTDNEEAMKLIIQLPNLFGDTCWVEPKKTLKLIQMGYEDKIMFGTDNTIDGLDTLNHEYYREYLSNFKNLVSEAAYKKLTYENAIKVFSLQL